MKRDERGAYMRLSCRYYMPPPGLPLVSLPLILLLFYFNYDDASRHGRMSKGFRYVERQSEGGNVLRIVIYSSLFIYIQSVNLQKWQTIA
jgi:hypothetical protein